MSTAHTETGRVAKRPDGAPVARLPRRTTRTTKQMHNGLLRALKDRRFKRAFR